MLFVLSARCSENLLNWFTMPRNVLYDSCTFCGGGRSKCNCLQLVMILLNSTGADDVPEELKSACSAQTKLSFSGTLSAPLELFKKIIKNLLKKKLINARKKLINAPVSGRPPELTK